MTYRIILHPDAKESLDEMDKSVRLQILKKIHQLERDDLTSRHLKHGLPFFVEEPGQYRICFTIDEAEKTKTVWFAGDHKQYQKWFSSLK